MPFCFYIIFRKTKREKSGQNGRRQRDHGFCVPLSVAAIPKSGSDDGYSDHNSVAVTVETVRVKPNDQTIVNYVLPEICNA